MDSGENNFLGTIPVPCSYTFDIRKKETHLISRPISSRNEQETTEGVDEQRTYYVIKKLPRSNWGGLTRVRVFVYS